MSRRTAERRSPVWLFFDPEIDLLFRETCRKRSRGERAGAETIISGIKRKKSRNQNDGRGKYLTAVFGMHPGSGI
jgi:hypothetical protein